MFLCIFSCCLAAEWRGKHWWLCKKLFQCFTSALSQKCWQQVQVFGHFVLLARCCVCLVLVYASRRSHYEPINTCECVHFSSIHSWLAGCPLVSQNGSYLLLCGGLRSIDGAVEQHVACGSRGPFPSHSHGGDLLIVNVHPPHGTQGNWKTRKQQILVNHCICIATIIMNSLIA